MEIIGSAIVIGAAIIIGFISLGLSKRRTSQSRPYRTIDEIAQETVITQIPTPLAAETCSHDWEVATSHSVYNKSITVLKCPHCGSIDKTVVEAEIPKRCKHRWTFDEKYIVLTSAYEQMAAAADKHNRSIYSKRTSNRPDSTAPAWKLPSVEIGQVPQWMFQKKFIQVRVCRDCGEIDKILTSNYDKLTDKATTVEA